MDDKARTDKHRSQDPDNKKDDEPDPEILKEAIELIRKAKLSK